MESLNRILTLLLRHAYLYAHSWPRIAGTVMWPVVNMLTMGLLNKYLSSAAQPNSGIIFGVILAGMLLWDWFIRTQVGTILALWEEVWSRNFGQLFATPMRDWEYIASILCVGVCAGSAMMIPVMLAAKLCFGFSVMSLGWKLALLLFNLTLFGWAFGLFSAALILRFGQSAEWLVWSLPYVIGPVAAIYYPVSVLPGWLQAVSWGMPLTYVFEGMRTILHTGDLPMRMFWQSLGLNAVYFAGTVWLTLATLGNSRQRGALLQVGE